jgi:hypothetical protein
MRKLTARLRALLGRSLDPGLALALGMMLVPTGGLANSSGPPNERTGAPGEGNCSAPGFCHSDKDVGSGDGALEIGLRGEDGALIVPPSYVPDGTYTIEVRLSQEGQLRWGFELTALDEAGASVGNLAKLDAETKVSVSQDLGRQYVMHTSEGTAEGQPFGHEWSFEWTAPPEDVGDVIFYVAGNAADNNGIQFDPTGMEGDFIYTEEARISLPEPGGAPLALGAAVALGVITCRRGRARSSGAPRGSARVA